MVMDVTRKSETTLEIFETKAGHHIGHKLVRNWLEKRGTPVPLALVQKILKTN